MPRRYAWVRSPLRTISAHNAFLLRLIATFVGTMAVIGCGLYIVQAHDARQIAVADGANLQVARGELIERAYRDASVGEDPMDEVREVLSLDPPIAVL